MRNNLPTVLEKLQKIENKTPAQISMMNMLAELTDHSVAGYANIEDQIILFDCDSRLFNGQVEMEFRQKKDVMVGRIVFPINCRPQTREKLARLCHVINRTMLIGGFEYQPYNGECAFKYAHYYGDSAMTKKQVRGAIGTILAAIRHYEDTMIPLLNGIEPKKGEECREYAQMAKYEEDASATAQSVEAAAQAAAENQTAEQASAVQNTQAQEAANEENSSAQAEVAESAQAAAEAARPAQEEREASPLAFNVDNDEMLRLFNDSCSASAERKARKNEPKPVERSEAEEEREEGGIPVQPEVADSFELEPGQIGIALDDSGEMVGLLTGGMTDEDGEAEAEAVQEGIVDIADGEEPIEEANGEAEAEEAANEADDEAVTEEAGEEAASVEVIEVEGEIETIEEGIVSDAIEADEEIGGDALDGISVQTAPCDEDVEARAAAELAEFWKELDWMVNGAAQTEEATDADADEEQGESAD